jgi:hypothetical protein
MTSSLRISSHIRRPIDRDAMNRTGLRIMGIIALLLAAFFAWVTKGFHIERDLSRYREIQLTYSDCRFEKITHSKGLPTRQIAFTTAEGRYVMEDGVWKQHFRGPELAQSLAGGGTVRAWLHPDFPHILRGIAGGRVDIPPQWGLDYDQRNIRTGAWTAAAFAFVGAALWLWR